MSFLTPLFLAAAGAALAPVLLHLVRRMKAKEVPFSSLMFLQATPMERIRRRKLRDILLLLLRVIIIILLAVAFARPFLTQERLPFVPQREDESVILLFDQSLSMQAGDSFAQAREALLRTVSTAENGDELALVGFSDEATRLVPLTRDRALLKTAAATLRPTSRATDYYSALQLAEDMLKEARHKAQRVVLISDLQRSGFSSAMEEYALPEGVTLDIVQAGTGDETNRYFHDFKLSMQLRAEHSVVRLDARRQALRKGDHTDLIIEERKVGRTAASQGGLGPVSFQQLVPRAGTYQGHLALEPDDLDADNRHYFTFVVSQRPSLLVIAADRDAFFLRSALDLSAQSRFDFTRGRRISAAALLRHDVAFIANAERLSREEAAALRTFAERGGSVVVSFGDALLPSAFDLSPLRVGRLEGIVQTQSDEQNGAFIAQVAPQHPIFTVLSGSSALLRPKFRSYVRIAPADGSTILGSYDTGDVFLLEQRIGQGTVLVYTSSFGTSWSDLPLHELFVPLLHQIASYATTLQDRPRQFVVGDPVPLNGSPGAVVDVSTPDGSVYKVTMDSTGTGFFRETEWAGHYMAVLREDVYSFSVNTNPRESDLAVRGHEETYATVAGSRRELATTPQQTAFSGDDAEKDQKLWRIAIIAVLGLFALETLLAHRRRAPKQ